MKVLMPDTCRYCGDLTHSYTCAQELSLKLAESVHQHNEDLRDMASMRVELASLRDQVVSLSMELRAL
jgi:hypothetical protein